MQNTEGLLFLKDRGREEPPTLQIQEGGSSLEDEGDQATDGHWPREEQEKHSVMTERTSFSCLRVGLKPQGV